jgi:Rieske Fe-S protein
MNYSRITTMSRRSALKASTAVVGGVALVGIAIPFFGSLAPSARARAAGAPGGAGLGTEWPGSFYCPCHGSKFDLAGRVFENVPAPLNMEVPPPFVGR